MSADINTILIATLALAAAAVLIGIGWAAGRRRSTAAAIDAGRAAMTGAPSDAERTEAFDYTAVSAFTRELFAAQTTADVRATVARRLPTLLGTRRMWVSGHAGGQRQLIVPEDNAGRPDRLVEEEFQEWTTSPLRAGRDVVGMIGVESGAARSERTRRVIEMVAPFIGQALQNAQIVDALRETSLHDALTGTATRREGLARLHAELKRAQRTGASMAVMLLDLDRFKAINDRSGHATGDAVLTAVGQTLRRTLRASDIRCRWGGEEFLVVVPDTDVDRAQIVANGLLRNIAATTVTTPQGPVGSTTSIGLTMSRPREVDVEAILHRADVALYRAKHAGRACVRVVLSDSDEEPMPAPAAPAAKAGEGTTLPFPDRRNPDRPDRRRVPSPGRRATDPR
jgi:diguanylate cyclase (GGDEF)-like protein